MGTLYNPKTNNTQPDEDEKKRQAALEQQQDNDAVAQAAAAKTVSDYINENADNGMPEGVTSPHRQPQAETELPENALADVSSSANPADASINASTTENRLENGAIGENKGPSEASEGVDDTDTGSAVEPTDEDEVDKAKKAMNQADADLITATKEANESRNKSFSDIVNDYYQRMQKEEAQMQAEEEANRNAAMWTGATELAAGIANLIGVGQGHAVSQQYKNYSQDWMKKADADIREHRNRRANMTDVLQRLKMQEQDLLTSSKIEEAKLKAQKAQADYAAAVAAKKAKDDAEEKAWKREVTERELKINEDKVKASIEQGKQNTAQGWAQLKQNEERFNAQQMASGYIKDEKAPNGWRYDPAAAGVTSKKGDNTVPLVLMDEDGNISVANLTKEQKNEVFDNAYNAIKSELGENEAAEFEKKHKLALDDDAKGQVLREYMGRSKIVEEIIRKLDSNYKAQTGYAQGFGKRSIDLMQGPVTAEKRGGYTTDELLSGL